MMPSSEAWRIPLSSARASLYNIDHATKGGSVMAEEKNGNGKKGEEEPHGGNSEFNNFQRLLKQVLSAPKEKIDERRAEYEQDKERKKRAG